jgi:hypothetical protein
MYSASAITIAVLSFIVACGGAYGLGTWLFKKDRELEARRRRAAELAAKLQSFGLVRIPAMLLDYSVGDYIQLAEDIVKTAELFMGDDTHIMAEFEDVYEEVLNAKLNTVAGRTLLAAKLKDAMQPSDPTAVANAPTAQMTNAKS